LVGGEFDKYFEEDPTARRKLVDNLADWIDKNNLVDEAVGFQGGYEDQRYQGGSYTVKNGKLSTPGEILLVAGIGDDIYQKLISNVTIYGDEKVNLCLANESMIKAFVIRYSNVTEEVDPILPDNEELLIEIVAAVQEACMTPNPKAHEVANAVLKVLNLPPEAATVASKEPPQPEKTEESAQEGQVPKPTVVPTKLTEQISTENRFYSFDLTGSSGDIILNIKAVIHTEDRDPDKWKMLFYRIE
jgi:hypothetical protein